jgi:hypothetical protein
MSKTIKLFMWGYQPHFRLAVELRAKRVFELLARIIHEAISDAPTSPRIAG